MLYLVVVSPIRKEKKRKRNIDNDLAILPSHNTIFDKGHFPRCLSSYSREQMPPGRLTPEIKSLAPEPFGINEPAPIFFLPIFTHPRLFTPPISPNLPTHSESSSLSSLLILSKWSSVKIEEVKDVEDEDVEIYSPSPSSSEAGPS